MVGEASTDELRALRGESDRGRPRPLSESNPDRIPGRSQPAHAREPWYRSPFLKFVAMRAATLPFQLVLVLLLLYFALDLPGALAVDPHLSALGFFQSFAQMVTNIFTGNWGMAPSQYTTVLGPVTYFQLYGEFLGNSIQLAIFGLLISAAIAYPLGLYLGWTRRPGVDAPARMGTLTAALLPVFLVAWLVIIGLFFAFFNTFQDIDAGGITPSITWVVIAYDGRIPSWIIYGLFTRPTGLPLIDGALHGAWTFELITFVKTLIQASVIALAYVAIFLRQARSLVAGAGTEPHIVAARSRGLSESTLLWRHTGRRVLPTFMLVFALTIPGYFLAQFAVETAFNDSGIGYLTFFALTTPAPVIIHALRTLEGVVFVLAAFVLVAVLVADIVARRLDPRESRD